MKLLLCLRCYDIRTLFVMERTTCRCGSTWGQYLVNELDAVFAGEGLLIGISNPDLEAAIHAQLTAGDLASGLGRTFAAWVIPNGAPTVRRANPGQIAGKRIAGKKESSTVNSPSVRLKRKRSRRT